MKYCSKCGEDIIEKDFNSKWCMIITKRGQKIIEFSCFHFECWREFWEESVKVNAEKD